MQRNTLTRALAAGTLLALAAQAQAAQARVTHICPSWDRSNDELSVRIDSGCISTSRDYIGNDVAIEVDQNYATIRVTGTMEFSSGGRIQTADCMGGKSITLRAQNIEARRYSVVFNDQVLGVSDLIANPQPQECQSVTAPARFGTFERTSFSQFQDWSDNPIDGWQDWTGTSVIGLLEPLLAGHPETEEGAPTVSLNISKRQWAGFNLRNDPTSRDPFIAVEITRHGFLDDSVSGDRLFAQVRQTAEGWKIIRLFGQNLCARGEHAGQWTKERCA
ncbi:MAG: hypothetical protein ABJP48_07905 [Erythrobacter sp.]